jgi:hypothetical protein
VQSLGAGLLHPVGPSDQIRTAHYWCCRNRRKLSQRGSRSASLHYPGRRALFLHCASAHCLIYDSAEIQSESRFLAWTVAADGGIQKRLNRNSLLRRLRLFAFRPTWSAAPAMRVGGALSGAVRRETTPVQLKLVVSSEGTVRRMRWSS